MPKILIHAKVNFCLCAYTDNCDSRATIFSREFNVRHNRLCIFSKPKSIEIVQIDKLTPKEVVIKRVFFNSCVHYKAPPPPLKKRRVKCIPGLCTKPLETFCGRLEGLALQKHVKVVIRC